MTEEITKEPKMLIPIETVRTLAKLHQAEILADAERGRLLARARRSRSRKVRESRLQN